jgi:uncharacterized protein YciI
MPLYVTTILATGPREEVEAAAADHIEHLKRLRDQGRLRAAGRLAADEGFLEIFEAADRMDAENVARSSPLVEAGLGAWMLREWVEVEFD